MAKEKHAGGRPTKYTNELFDKALDYLDNWANYDTVPQLIGLAEHCDISEDTLHEWRKHENKKEFSELCARVMGLQKRTLVNNGLRREYDSGLTKLMLMKHGYSDRQEIEHSHVGGKPVEYED